MDYLRVRGFGEDSLRVRTFGYMLTIKLLAGQMHQIDALANSQRVRISQRPEDTKWLSRSQAPVGGLGAEPPA